MKLEFKTLQHHEIELSNIRYGSLVLSVYAGPDEYTTTVIHAAQAYELGKAFLAAALEAGYQPPRPVKP